MTAATVPVTQNVHNAERTGFRKDRTEVDDLTKKIREEGLRLEHVPVAVAVDADILSSPDNRDCPRDYISRFSMWYVA